MKKFKTSLLLTLLLASTSFASTSNPSKMPLGKRIGESLFFCGPVGIMVTAGVTIFSVTGSVFAPVIIGGFDAVDGHLPTRKQFSDIYSMLLKDNPQEIKSVWEECYSLAAHGVDKDLENSRR